MEHRSVSVVRPDELQTTRAVARVLDDEAVESSQRPPPTQLGGIPPRFEQPLLAKETRWRTGCNVSVNEQALLGKLQAVLD